MKNIILILAAISLVACADKTSENSAFSNQILQLDATYDTVDSNYRVFLSTDMDTMNHFRKIVNEKYATIKNIYTTDAIDTNYEKIMLIARGQFTKKLEKIGERSENIKKEFEKSTLQYRTLRENLIYETIEEEKSLIFFAEENQALIILNSEIVSFNEDLSFTISLAGVIIPQLDSIINVHEKPE
jgi:hypothetical protein